MDDMLLDRLVANFKDVMISLYQDNPGIGEFKWEQIYERLPNLNGFDGNQGWHSSKEMFTRNISKIIRASREDPYNMIVFRKNGYYKVQNIEGVIQSYYKHKKTIPPPFKKPRIFQELWGGSGVVGKEVKKEA